MNVANFLASSSIFQHSLCECPYNFHRLFRFLQFVGYFVLLAMALWCTSLLLAISAVCVQSQFLQPPDTTVPNIKNPVYTVGQNLDLQWNTDVSSVDVTMWQQGNGTLFTLLGKPYCLEGRRNRGTANNFPD